MDSAFLSALAQARPDPGGGAAAAHGAALGLALVEKVVRLERQRPGTALNSGVNWGGLLVRVGQVADALQRLQDEDIQAYARLVQTRDQSDPEAFAAALEEAVACPLRIMQQAQEGLALAAQAGSGCRPHLLADLLVACELLAAAFRGAYHIARANLPRMRQEARRAVWTEDLSHTLTTLEAELQLVRGEIQGRSACP
jgi:formiminotetrahydrofolate cyclodeaminase